MKISANENTGTKTDHIQSTVIVVPRHATDVQITKVPASDANVASTFLLHDVCLIDKTSGTTCPVASAPSPAVHLSDAQAKFFMQVWTTVTGGNTAA